MDGGTIIVALIVNIFVAIILIKVRTKYFEESSTSSNVLIFIISLLAPFLGILLIIYYGIRLMFKNNNMIVAIKNVSDTAQERVHEYRVQKIAEDEAIRATVKKSLQDSDDTTELQELINKAVAKGDTETAQALLSILNNKK